ncbi:YncE family protein [Streptomyces noursei]|uniref:YncE family protein n=1 Tax=Streptomyces noursei TaxID=1971 RepID=UPI00167C1B6F|nr:YncE family protein [Streptomyces noursei]MCZ1021300.1 YncE family protein [Streptomyces noursei]GGX55702.1 hypothetical protein GCM10010341_90610 [Streptomyces noursei]
MSDAEVTGPAVGRASRVPVMTGGLFRGEPVVPGVGGVQGPPVAWVDINRVIGPLTVEKLGLSYSGGKVWLLFDAALGLGPLNVGVDGLGLGVALSDLSKWEGTLRGLSLDFRKGPLEIGGAFVNQPVDDTTPYDLLVEGSVVIRTPELTIAAVGAYEHLKSGFVSLFLFGEADSKFGGPPPFTVNGFCAGFGYNSNVRVPGQAEVAQFPLVAGIANPRALGPSPHTPLSVLQQLTEGSPPCITADVGQLWFAIGVDFTSFEFISSRAVLLLEVGDDLTVALLGVSRASFPLKGESDTPYAEVELGLEAVYQSSKAMLAMSAVLSPNSFVIDPSCVLTGGFAFDLWFGGSAHPGDFVLCLGGYHPDYGKPVWYPDEPRLGFSWSVSSAVTLSGKSYFALTPAAVMAGGALDIRFHSGGLQAWFTAHADLLISWKPVHFRAGIGVSIGVSATVDLGLFSITVSVEVGADLDLWGPPTGGTATVHLWFIDFTVDFGSGSTEPKSLDWVSFTALLPAEPKQAVRAVVVSGLLPATGQSSANGDETEGWTVSTSGFAFATHSAVPLSTVTVDNLDPLPGDAVNIRPMGVTGQSSTQKVSLEGEGGEVNMTGWAVQRVLGNVPQALWGLPQDERERRPDDPTLLEDQLTGVMVSAPLPVLGYSPGPVAEEDLLFDDLSPYGIVPLHADAAPVGPVPQPGEDVIGTIAAQVAVLRTAFARSRLFAELARAGFTQPSSGESGDWADQPLTHYAGLVAHSLPDEPQQLEGDPPAGTYAWVTNQGDGTVTVIDAEAALPLTIGQPLATGDGGSLFCPVDGGDGYRVHILRPRNQKVARFDTTAVPPDSEVTISQLCQGGSTNGGMAASADGRYLFITQPPNGKMVVAQVDSPDDAKNAETGSSKPAGVACGKGDSGLPLVFVSNEDDGTVAVFSFDGSAVQRLEPLVKVGKGPNAIAAAPTSAIAVVVNEGDASVTVVDGTQRSSNPVGTVGASEGLPTGPRAVVVAPDAKHTYVTHDPGGGQPGTVTVLALAPPSVSTTGAPAGREPCAVALTPDGQHAYIANAGDDTVTVLDVTVSPPQPVGQPIPVGKQPSGIVFTQ